MEIDRIATLICNVLSNSLNYVIFFLATVEFVVMIVSLVKLCSLRYYIGKLFKEDKRRSMPPKKFGRGKVSTTEETESTRDWNKFTKFRQSYQKKMIWYDVFSSTIQLFPLLGILGTVAGLYISMSAEIYLNQGVKFALSSTIYGIIFAVVFKFVDVIFISCFINYIDDGIDRYEKEYDVINEEAKSNCSMPGSEINLYNSVH